MTYNINNLLSLNNPHTSIGLSFIRRVRRQRTPCMESAVDSCQIPSEEIKFPPQFCLHLRQH